EAGDADASGLRPAFEAALELGALHDEAQSLLARGDHARARQTLEWLLERRPGFVAGMNNLSQIFYFEGRLEPAIATARDVLALAPENIHALANLARYLLLSGRVEEAWGMAARLRAVDSERTDAGVKKAEALSYVGDDQGVLDAFAAAERAGLADPPLGDP